MGQGEKPAKEAKRKATVHDGSQSPRQEGQAKGVRSAASTARSVKKRRRTTEEADNDELGVGLMQLRSLLAPAGWGEAVQPPPAGEKSKGGMDDDDIGGIAEKDESGRRCPDWTSRYHVVDASEAATPLEELSWPLHAALERSLRKAGFSKLFAIQAAVVPLLSRSAEFACDEDSPYSCDVCVSAPTGQGKTLAYAVPIVQALINRLAPEPRALVLLPTRDLAMQVFRVFDTLRRGLGPGVAQVSAQCLVGQRSFADEQRRLSENPPDIIVCTPGRFADHSVQLNLSRLRWFVADEADRLLTQGYHRWLDTLEKISSSSQPSPYRPRLQKLLLSATMTWNPQKLATLKLKRPIYFFSSQTGQHSTPSELNQHYLKCKIKAKPLAVLHVLGCLIRGELEGIASDEKSKAVVFCSSVDTAHRLARLLQICTMPSLRAGTGKAEKSEDSDVLHNLPECLRIPGAIAEFSSHLVQRQRTKLLKRFRNGHVRCLVCSDVVARGIDIPEVNAVINYSAPSHLQTYIHRVGRTARAGKAGHTFTFVRRVEMSSFERMLRRSADCWDKIRKFSLPQGARDTRQAGYPSAVERLHQCLKQEQSGEIPPREPLLHDQSNKKEEAAEEREEAEVDDADEEEENVQIEGQSDEAEEELEGADEQEAGVQETAAGKAGGKCAARPAGVGKAEAPGRQGQGRPREAALTAPLVGAMELAGTMLDFLNAVCPAR